jgi:cob(I)alamin adenosyltransferase
VKIYTRTGDDGSTGLLGAGRVPKSAPRVEAYGAVDELNACLGVVRAFGATGLDEDLAAIQAKLFTVGALLATTEPEPPARVGTVTDADIAGLEAVIDRLEAGLPALKNFILPAGTPLAAHLHLARTVCRRAERRVVALLQHEHVDPAVVRYLNRLADLLFVMARDANRQGGGKEVEWRAP